MAALQIGSRTIAVFDISVCSFVGTIGHITERLVLLAS